MGQQAPRRDRIDPGLRRTDHGSHDLQVYVIPSKQKADLSPVAAYFRDGETRVLDVKVSESGAVSVNLR